MAKTGYKMKITCPKNKKHNRFRTTAHECHDWIIDENGNYIKDLGCIQVTHGPKIGNTFTCIFCGVKAKEQAEVETKAKK